MPKTRLLAAVLSLAVVAAGCSRAEGNDAPAAATDKGPATELRLGYFPNVTHAAALPGFLGGLKQGWAFSWRSLMAAELIATSPELGEGLGQYLHNGMSLSDISLVFAGILLIFVVGVGIELLVFRPLENSVLRARGLTVTAR